MPSSDTDSQNIKPLPKTKDAMAVALAGEQEADKPPKVVAGGRGRIAEQILEVAFAQGVPVREDADLAQLLTSIDIDSDIPVEAFVAVAEILTYVYQANDAMRSTETAGDSADTSDKLSAASIAKRWTKESQT